MKKIHNEWIFTGDIFYFKELETSEFVASIKLRGNAKRVNAISTQVAEISCLAEKSLYEGLKNNNIGMYSKNITLSGHIEQWNTNKHGKPVNKMMLIADYLVQQD